MTKLTRIRIAFLDFLRFGLFTFGGGWGIIAQMQQLYVRKRRDMTEEELIDITSVARSLPGTMIGNVAMLYGYHIGGVLGGIACVIGMILPPMVILTAITFFYTAFQDAPWVAAAMAGVRASVVPIIACAVLGMAGSAFRFPACIAVAALTLVLYSVFHVSSILLIVLAGLLGLLLCELHERKGGRGA